MAKPGPRTTYRYSRDFKATAVRLSNPTTAYIAALHPDIPIRMPMGVHSNHVQTQGRFYADPT